MSLPNPQSVRMRRVCQELARLRKERGASGRDVERKVGIPPSTLSRIETCQRPILRDDLIALLVLYDVPRETRRALLKLHDQADQPSLIDELDLHAHQDLAVWMGFEQDASDIRNYQVLLVPGLLQTEDYARAVIENCGVPLSKKEIENRVAARMARQGLLRQDARPTLWVLLHEAALRQNVGGPSVMRDQLRHLAVLSTWPGNKVQLVPDGVGAHPGLGGTPFVILDYAGLPSLVHMEQKTTSVYLEERADVYTYKLVFNGILAKARSAEESTQIIRETAEALS